MMIFHAYENWRAHGHRVTVHAASCAFCNDGRGACGGPRTDNGKWHKLGEFVSCEEALACASRSISAPHDAHMRSCYVSLRKPPGDQNGE